MKLWAGVIADIHCGVYRQLKKPNPQQVNALKKFWIGTHQKGKRLAMSKLIVTPLLKPAKNRVEFKFRTFLDLSINCDVPSIANFF